MKKLIKWGLILFGGIFAISMIAGIIGAIFVDFTPEDKLNFAINDFNEGKYEDAKADFLKFKEGDSLYNKAQIYLKKIDSIEIANAIKDSINHRTELINKQFSAWNGEHLKLKAAIKQSMNNPNSYEHVNTTYNDLGTKLKVNTTFRGTNAFGGVVTNTVSCYTDLQGNIIEFLK